MGLDPNLTTDIFQVFAKPFVVRDHYINVPIVIIVVTVVIVQMVVVVALGLINDESIVFAGLKSV